MINILSQILEIIEKHNKTIALIGFVIICILCRKSIKNISINIFEKIKLTLNLETKNEKEKTEEIEKGKNHGDINNITINITTDKTDDPNMSYLNIENIQQLINTLKSSANNSNNEE